MKVSVRQLQQILMQLPDPLTTRETQVVRYVTEEVPTNVLIVAQTSTTKTIVFNLERLMFKNAKGDIHDMSYWTIDI